MNKPSVIIILEPISKTLENVIASPRQGESSTDAFYRDEVPKGSCIAALRRFAPRNDHISIFETDSNQFAVFSYSISGITILSNGFYRLVPAVILSFIMAIPNAWVLLVEINR